jgi:hypothetical protein
MSDWRDRAEITADVVLFRYASDPEEREAGEVYVWDLDKTYLDTTFETLHGLIRTVMEKAFQKQNVPGTSTLVRALRNHWQETHKGKKDFPIFFITASPPQLERKIHEKLNFDGIYPFGLFCKDNLQNIRPSRLRRLTQQVGYKLQALLQLRLHLRENVRQVLWGDDSELDAIIYSLYSDLCARRMNEEEARQVLKYYKVTGMQVETILRLLEGIPQQDPVEKIYINLASDTDAEYYLKFGRRILPTYDSFQLALDLFQDKRLSAAQVIKVAVDLIQNYGFAIEDLEASIDNLVRRPQLGREALEEILPILKAQHLVSSSFVCSFPAKAVVTRSETGRVFELEGVTEPWIPQGINYLYDDR